MCGVLIIVWKVLRTCQQSVEWCLTLKEYTNIYNETVVTGINVFMG